MAVSCPACGSPTPLRNAALDRIRPAPVGSRVKAAVAETLPALVLVIAAVVAVFLDLQWQVWVGLLGAAVLAVLAVGLTGGQGFGKAGAGLRVIDEHSGAPIGGGAMAVRLLLRLLMTVGTLGVAAFSYRWDPSGREQTWWDRATHTRVVDAHQRAGDDLPWLNTGAAPMAGAGPVTSVPGFAQRPSEPPLGPPSAGTAISPQPQRLSGPGLDEPTVVLPGRDTGIDGPTVILEQPTAEEPTVALTKQPAEPTGESAQPRAEQPEQPPARHEPRPYPADPAPERESAQPRAEQPEQPPARHEPRPHPTDPAPERESAEPRAPEDDDEPEEHHTVIRPERAAALIQRGVTLRWDAGSEITVEGMVLIGRDPMPADGEQVDRRLAVGNESRGVSKTHLALLVSDGALSVIDRHSTNGVRIVRAGGEVITCVPGEPTSTEPHDRIAFGGRWLEVLD
nr:RDD family protein [Nakamurella aerolata]